MNLEWQQTVKQSRAHSLWHDLSIGLEQYLEPTLRSKELIEDYYLPLFLYLYETVLTSRQPTIVVGINAPQGGGKSTLTSYLVELFARCNLKAATLSIDDFYLPRTEQIQLARDNPENIYLQQRGYPGTHDIALGAEILAQLKSPGAAVELQLPRYDKSRHGGQGDRTEKHKWPTIQHPVNVVLLEGWMLGFQPLPADQISNTHLVRINNLLQDYLQWYRFLDTFVYLCPEDQAFVVDWRSEAEERMKAQGLPGMSAADVREYAKKFLPAYQLYGHHLACNPPTPHSCMNIIIGKNRLPLPVSNSES